MQHISSLETLYSALLQGGATIVAILGGFLLTFGVAHRANVTSLIHASDRTGEAVRKQENAVEKLLERTKALSSTRTQPGIPDSTITEEDLNKEREARQAAVQQLKETRSLIAELEERAASALERLDIETYSALHFQRAGLALMLLTLFCIVLPSIALAWLPVDTDPIRRSIFAVFGFATALSYICILVLRPGMADDMIPEDAIVTPQHGSRISRTERVLIVVLILSGLLFFGSSFLPFPPLEQGSSAPGVTIDNLPLPAAPASVTASPT